MNETLSYILAALIGSLPAMYALWRGSRKEKADADKSVAEAAGELTETAMGLLRSLKERVTDSEQLSKQQNETLQARVEGLERLSREQAEAIRELSRKLERALDTIKSLLRGVALLIHQLREVAGKDVVPAFSVPLFDEDADLKEIERIILRGITQNHDR